MSQMPLNYYNSHLEVDLTKIASNVEKIRAYTGGLELLPVIKSNAYGFGTVAIASHLIQNCKIRFLGCARIFEACQILDSGCDNIDILVIGAVPDYSVPIAVQRNIQFPVFRKEVLRLISEEAIRQNKSSVKIHIKVETGMNRIGVRPGAELQELLEAVKKYKNITVDGIFTHFATADRANAGQGNDFTRHQFNLFRKAIDQAKDAGICPRYIHCCNTGATTWLKDAYSVCSHVRVGSLYLGYSSVQDDWNPIGVEESGSWKTTIVNLRNIDPGESVGYGRAFMPNTSCKIATIGIGYGDGYTRSFAVSGAPCLIDGKRCKFVGTAMDMSFIDVTGIDCAIGDEVTLFGDDGHGNRISGLEIGHLMGETRLAMFTHITERVARIYKLH